MNLLSKLRLAKKNIPDRTTLCLLSAENFPLFPAQTGRLALANEALMYNFSVASRARQANVQYFRGTSFSRGRGSTSPNSAIMNSPRGFDKIRPFSHGCARARILVVVGLALALLD